jgi:hypothetical protein
MEYVKRERKLPVCLECGDKIRYGRSDKKFCCEDCKTRHYNNLAKGSRAYRRRVISRLSRNYQVLERILRSGESSAEIMDMIAAGFSPDSVTGYHKSRSRSDEYWCFDIKYRMSESRVHSISKIQNVSLTLSPDL